MVQEWVTNSGDTCSLFWGFGGVGSVPGGHILAHTGKRPHRSPSSALRSSPRYWVQLVQDNCSGPPLDKTETGREEDGQDCQDKVTEAEGAGGFLRSKACAPASWSV